MSEDKKDPKALEDVRQGLGLLFRAARTAVKQLPTDRLEEVVVTGAKEVGRALGNVADTLEKEVNKVTGAVTGARTPPPPSYDGRQEPPAASKDDPEDPPQAPPADGDG